MSNIDHRVRICVNKVGGRLRLIFSNILAPQHRAGFGVDDYIISVYGLPDQDSPRRNRNAGLGRKIHLFSRRCSVALPEYHL